jgi:hypothetical protein
MDPRLKLNRSFGRKSRKSKSKKSGKKSKRSLKRRKSIKKSRHMKISDPISPVIMDEHLGPKEFFQDPIIEDPIIDENIQSYDSYKEQPEFDTHTNASDSDKVVRVLTRLYSKDLESYVSKIVKNITKEVNMEHRTENEVSNLVKKELIKSIKFL